MSPRLQCHRTRPHCFRRRDCLGSARHAGWPYNALGPASASTANWSRRALRARLPHTGLDGRALINIQLPASVYLLGRVIVSTRSCHAVLVVRRPCGGRPGHQNWLRPTAASILDSLTTTPCRCAPQTLTHAHAAVRRLLGICTCCCLPSICSPFGTLLCGLILPFVCETCAALSWQVTWDRTRCQQYRSIYRASGGQQTQSELTALGSHETCCSCCGSCSCPGAVDFAVLLRHCSDCCSLAVRGLSPLASLRLHCCFCWLFLLTMSFSQSMYVCSPPMSYRPLT